MKASLYFRAPQETNEILTKNLSNQLGRMFHTHSDSTSKSEVELFFASRVEAVTKIHTDFQENFTLQIFGKKKWFFKKGPVVNPVRAITPQFVNIPDQVIERQKLAFSVTKSDTVSDMEFHPPDLSEFETVVLSAGDFLYHPAGIWHQVETVEAPSFSINVSLHSLKFVDLFVNAMKTYLWSFEPMRRPGKKKFYCLFLFY